MSADSNEQEFAFEEADRFVEAQRQRWQPIKIRRALIGAWEERETPLTEQIELAASDGVLEHLKLNHFGIGMPEVEAILQIPSLSHLEINDSLGKFDPAILAALFEGLAGKAGFCELALNLKGLEPDSITPLAAGRLKSLRLMGLKGAKIEAGWFDALAGFEQLESLTVWSQAREIYLEDFSRIERLANLECLSFVGIGQEGVASVAGIENLPNLRSLRIRATPNLWIIDPEHFAESPTLRELHFSGGMREQKEIDFLAGCPRLEKLWLPDLSHLGDGKLAVIGELTELRSLTILGSVGGSYLESFRDLKRLEEFFLGVGRARVVGELDFPDAANFGAIHSMESLRILQVDSWRMTDGHFAALAGHPAIETIEFTRGGRCRNPLGEGFVQFVERCPALTTLDVTGAAIDDDCLHALAEVGSNLRRFDLFDSPPLSLHALNAFRRKNPACELMADPSDYCALKGETVFDFGQPQNLEFEQDEIDDLVARGAAIMTRMIRFDPMEGRLTDLGLSYLRASQTLRWVNLDHCPEVTLRGLELLSECPSLKGVTLPAEGSKVSDEEVAAFNEEFPDVKVARR